MAAMVAAYRQNQLFGRGRNGQTKASFLSCKEGAAATTEDRGKLANNPRLFHVFFRHNDHKNEIDQTDGSTERKTAVCPNLINF